MTDQLTTAPLKLDFNERGDQISPLATSLQLAGGRSLGESLWRYPEREPLEKQIAELNQLRPEQVICTNGGDEAIMLLMRLIKETSRLILPLPAFSQYTWGVKSWQLNAVQIAPNKDLSINIDGVLTAIESTPNSFVILTRPNNPTGEAIPLESLLDITESAKKNACTVFLDEAYIEFSEEYYQDSSVALTLLKQFDNLVILRTLSKAFGLAGIRLGYLLGNEDLINQFKIRAMPFNVPQPSLAIASLAIAQENRAEVKDYCQTIIDNRKQLIEWLTQSKIEVLPSQANFITIRLAQTQAQAVKSFLAKNNLLIRAFSEAEMSGCLRITIPYQIERLKTLLTQALTPELICLDMDGVLIDTSGSYEATIIKTVKQLGNLNITGKEITAFKNAGGFNNDWVLSQKLLEENGIKLSLEEVTQAFQKIYLGDNNDGLVINETSLLNEAAKQRFSQINQTQLAIVTGRPRTEASAGIQLLGLNNLDLIGLDDVDTPKPSPEGIEKLQCKYSQLSWMCGDNPDDMQAANGSNSLAIGIGKVNEKILYQAGADIVLNDINELETWLCPIQ